MIKPTAIVYSENEFGKLDGKVANGLVRRSDKYEIVGVIDSTLAGSDAGEYLDGIKNGIPVFRDIYEAIHKLATIPGYFIYGIAPLKPQLSAKEKQVIYTAIKMRMNVVNGLPEFLTEDRKCMEMALAYGISILDVRKPPAKKDLHTYTGQIRDIKTPIITVSGTDCAVGKRTTALCLVEALRREGLNAVFITTGQTGLLQGSKYGIAIDVLTSGFATGEVENAILQAQKESPDIIVVEGQGALSHQAFTSSSAIMRGAMPKAIILQHPPMRTHRCDFPKIPMPTLESEIELIEVFSRSPVIALTLNHENMTEDEVEKTILGYEQKFGLPTTDVLKKGCTKLIEKLYEVFPELVKLETV
ncbi:DUF1611 domain-containing protein [Fulvivirga sp. M361]|uniref:DUF1611 domain-containing protein n=1 Tax=Fulvivirga sp. M361 TaxID=2594266 RepID=UPI00117BA420|nr:DUF1611 domain-containing protein [Fulvivirga sp. M361]TRX46409.1 DUF1611 domain-containing protein [Fulvivirga sp. M361]